MVEEKKTAGKVLVEEITELENEKNRKVMREHLSYLLRRVNELQDQKTEIDESLAKANEELDKVYNMELDEFGPYIKKSAHGYMYSNTNNIAIKKSVLTKKLNLTFDKKGEY
jgi:hypothetical protein